MIKSGASPPLAKSHKYRRDISRYVTIDPGEILEKSQSAFETNACLDRVFVEFVNHNTRTYINIMQILPSHSRQRSRSDRVCNRSAFRRQGDLLYTDRFARTAAIFEIAQRDFDSRDAMFVVSRRFPRRRGKNRAILRIRSESSRTFSLRSSEVREHPRLPVSLNETHTRPVRFSESGRSSAA